MAVLPAGTEREKHESASVFILDFIPTEATYFAYKDCVWRVMYMSLSTYPRTIIASVWDVCSHQHIRCCLRTFMGLRIVAQRFFWLQIPHRCYLPLVSSILLCGWRALWKFGWPLECWRVLVELTVTRM